MEPGPRLRRPTLAAELAQDIGHAQQLRGTSGCLPRPPSPSCARERVLVQAATALGFAPHELDAALASIDGRLAGPGRGRRTSVLASGRRWSRLMGCAWRRPGPKPTRDAKKTWILTATLGIAWPLPRRARGGGGPAQAGHRGDLGAGSGAGTVADQPLPPCGVARRGTQPPWVRAVGSDGAQVPGHWTSHTGRLGRLLLRRAGQAGRLVVPRRGALHRGRGGFPVPCSSPPRWKRSG